MEHRIGKRICLRKVGKRMSADPGRFLVCDAGVDYVPYREKTLGQFTMAVHGEEFEEQRDKVGSDHRIVDGDWVKDMKDAMCFRRSIFSYSVSSLVSVNGMTSRKPSPQNISRVRAAKTWTGCGLPTVNVAGGSSLILSYPYTIATSSKVSQSCIISARKQGTCTLTVSVPFRARTKPHFL